MGQRHKPWFQASPVGGATPIVGQQADNHREEEEEEKEEALKGENHLGPLQQSNTMTIRAIKIASIGKKSNDTYIRSIEHQNKQKISSSHQRVT